MPTSIDEVRRRLTAMLQEPLLVEEYLRRYGPVLDIKYIKAVKEVQTKPPREIEEGKGDDPLYEIKVTCPACQRDQIPCYQLRAKSQQVVMNKFMVPSYKGAKGYRTVDYNYLAVTVCPRCLFASPDPKDFHRPSPDGRGVVRSGFTSAILSTIREKKDERMQILGALDDFRRPRTEAAAIGSYRLAIERASVEAFYEQPYAHFKMGAYALKLGKILKDSGSDNSAALKEALSHMEEEFKLSAGVNEDLDMQVIYLTVALGLKLHDEQKAAAYLGAFSRIRNEKLNQQIEEARDTSVLDRWAERAQRLWEDRDRDDLFTEE